MSEKHHPNKFKLFYATALSGWWVAAEDIRDVKLIVFEYETQFCTNTSSILVDIRDLDVVEVTNEYGDVVREVGTEIPSAVNVTALRSPRVILFTTHGEV